MKSLVALILFAISLGARADAQNKGHQVEWHSLDSWQQPQGLPQNSVLSLLQTRDGYLWVGTKGGVARFDGVRFTTYDDRNPQQILENEIWALAEGDDASVWIGSYGGGLSRLKDGHFTVYTMKDGLANNFITSLSRDLDGAIWIGTDGGVSRFKDGHFTTYTVKDGLASNAVRTVYTDPNGTIWIGTRNGSVHRFRNGKIYTQTIPGLSTAEVLSILYSRNQTLWVSTADGLYRQQSDKTTKFTVQDGLASERVNCTFEDETGELWIGTDRGLNKIKDGVISIHPLRNDHSSVDTVLAFQRDHEGSLWIGFRNEGLGRLRNGLFKSYTRKDGLADDYVSSVLQDEYGHIWLGTYNGLNLFKDGQFTTFKLPGVSNRIVSLEKDRAGNLWIGTADGLFKINLARDCNNRHCHPQIERIKGAPTHMYVRVIYADRSGAIWAGLTLEGLARYKDGKFILFTKKDGLSNQAVRAICEDHEGNLWIGTRGGLNLFKDGKFTVYNQNNGLVNDGVQAIYLDRLNTLWIATRQGLSRLKQGHFTNYTVKDGIFSNFVYSFVEDNLGNLWMSCSQGIFRVSKQQLDEVGDGKVRLVDSTIYGREHGLQSTIGTVGTHPGALKAKDGKLWFGTYVGVSVIDPAKLTRNSLAPPIYIEEARIDQTSYPLNKMAAASPGRGDIAFQYTALSFLAPEKVRFKYWLEGYDKDWIDAGNRRSAFYSNIPPGQYTFHVRAANNDGVWNETEASYTIYLKPHFYQTRWFYSLCILSLLVMAGGTYRFRIQQVKARERELILLVNERTQELQQEIAERKRADEAMRESRAMFQQLFESAPDATIVVNSQRQIIRLNTRAEAMFGYCAEELFGQPIEVLIPESLRERHAKDAEGYIAKPTRRGMAAGRELCGRRKDGSEFPAEIMLGPLETENGLVILGVVRDITERKQVEQALQQAKETAEAANRAKSEFLANMSHEIRTPMNAVIGMTGLLLDTSLNTEQREFVDIVRTSSDALLTIINDILDFSKIESGKLDLEQQPFDLATCIEEALDLLAPTAAEKGIEVAYQLAQDTPHNIIGDITRLRQILVNLLSNAVKFTNAGEVVISVSARQVASNRHEFQFAVRDTGIGIPQDRLDRLFKSFSQVDSSTTRQYGGTGLGLAISKRLSELMGGTMWVESEVGKGSTFFFRISATSTPLTSPHCLNGKQADLTNKRLLIVDDNATNRQILALLAKSWGMISEAVASGSEALELVKQGVNFDVAVLDLHMPVMDGIDLANQIKAHGGWRNMPLMIMLSSGGASRRELTARRSEDLFAGLLVKPVKPSQLYESLVRVLTENSVAISHNSPTEQEVEVNAVGHLTHPAWRILLAEDNVVNQKVAIRMLERLGYCADIAANGIEVLEAISLRTYDIILMDVMMPEMDGLEATRQIRQKHPSGSPRIIAMTANAMEGDREMCLAAGMDDYVSKPVRMPELQSALKRAEQAIAALDKVD